MIYGVVSHFNGQILKYEKQDQQGKVSHTYEEKYIKIALNVKIYFNQEYIGI
jgi:hypothetical protein